MKKIFFSVILLSLALSSFAQKNSDGEMVDDVLRLNNGLVLTKGTQLKINGPSGEDLKFMYLFHAPDNLFDDLSLKLENRLEPYYGGRIVTVRKVKYTGEKGQEGRWILKLRDDKKTDLVCDLMKALEVGEIGLLQTDVMMPTTPTSPATVKQSGDNTVPVSAADELTKLKKLMDDGVITKEEFEAQKKKLLEK